MVEPCINSKTEDTLFSLEQHARDISTLLLQNEAYAYNRKITNKCIAGLVPQT